MSRTLSGLFLVGALNRPRKRKGTNRENPRTLPEQIGKIPGKVPKGQKRTKKEGQVQIGKPPRLKHPRLAALESFWMVLGSFSDIVFGYRFRISFSDIAFGYRFLISFGSFLGRFLENRIVWAGFGIVFG